MQQIQTDNDSVQVVTGELWPKHRREISLLDLILVLAKHCRTIFAACAATAVVSLVVTFFIPNTYTAEVVILTPKEPTSMSDLVNGQGLLGGLSGSGGLGLNDPNDVYVTMLRGDGIGDSILKQFSFSSYYGKKTHVETLNALADDTVITSGHDGTISIKFSHNDPKTAAAVANAYVEELRKLTQQMDVSSARQRKRFFEEEFRKSKEALVTAEINLRKAMEASGVIDVSAQAGLALQGVAEMQGKIYAQEVAIRGLRTTMTERSPEIIKARQELAAMRAQLAEIERKQGGGDGDVRVATRNLPAKGMEYLRALRDVKYYEEIYTIMGKQYEAAVADTNAQGATVEVINPAWPPDRKSKPKRALIVLFCIMFTMFISYAWFLGKELLAQVERDATEGAKLAAIRASLAENFGSTAFSSLLRGKTRAD